jgi:D-amino peptidase
MRVFISVDIEGITGVCHVKQADDLGSPAWREACLSMRADLDAALEGCLGAGVAEVVVSDGHYDGDNLRADGLPGGVSLVSGAQLGLSMMEGVGEGFDAALFVGYHAMAGTEAAVLAHTWNGELARVTLVDEASGERREVGELGLNAAVAGAFGVPAVFASGDDKLAAEAQALTPGIVTAVVKEGISRTAATLCDPASARERIRAGVERALRADRRPEPMRWDGRSLELEFGRVEYCDKAAALPGARRLDGRRLLLPAAVFGDYLGVYRAFVVCATLAES